ncbi:MAG: phosphopentomutase [Syntrophomonadaceae bacterium]|nr:phosphopentomutase [Syntrophomonadaceae bacterium]MDH7498472.1 phosphopentomutase [Syntrophomonadaceae bacterium]
MKRVTVVVLDSAGIGELPDAAQYGDQGSNTLGNIARCVGGLRLPNLERMGLGRIAPLQGVRSDLPAAGAFGRMAERSAGKDTTTGHWELMGLVLPRPFPTYPGGFPPELIAEFERRIGRRVLGNTVASGTVIIEELGPQHLATGYPIVYTSADSVFQIAAHEEVIPVEELYRMCEVARELLRGEHAVGRVIARPFTGTPGHFVRTPRRHDYSLAPPSPTLLDLVAQAGLQSVGVGKIYDIFAGRGLTRSVPAAGNREGQQALRALVAEDFSGLVLANLVDFDMLYGHRNDVEGYARALEDFDAYLPGLLEVMGPGDVLVITADHGCDPTTPSTDHSREYVPLLVYGADVTPGIDLGTRDSFADLASTVADLLGVPAPGLAGQSFAALLRGGTS